MKRIKKRWLICQEISFGKYTILDSGAIHSSLKSAKEHLLDCDDSRGDLFILSTYRMEDE